MSNIDTNFYTLLNESINDSNSYKFIPEMYKNGSSFKEICLKMIEDWDGNVFSSGSQGLAKAYLTFLNKEKMNSLEKEYLRQRAGIIGLKCKPEVIIVTFKDLLEKIGGNKEFERFGEWIDSN